MGTGGRASASAGASAVPGPWRSGAGRPSWPRGRAGQLPRVDERPSARAHRLALAATLIAFAGSLAHGHAVSHDRCLAAAPLESIDPRPVTVGCDVRLAAALGHPRRTQRAIEVVFTTEVWPEVTTATVLNANTRGAPGAYGLTAGTVRVTARATADVGHVDASVEVTNHTNCQLLLDVRFLDGGEYVSRPWSLRVRAGRDVLARQATVLTVRDVRLKTPLDERTSADEFAAEFVARFVDCDRRLRLRPI